MSLEERGEASPDFLKQQYSDLSIILVCFSVKNAYSWQSVMWKHIPEIRFFFTFFLFFL